MNNQHPLEHRYQQVRQQIAKACAAAQRSAAEVQLLAVSKTKPPEMIEAAYHFGQKAFGENYLQEALAKKRALSHLEDIEWYFIGALQSNKARDAAEHFDWVMTVDRAKIARRLHELRPDNRKPLNVCIQVNISEEASKAGVTLEELPALVEVIAALPKLTLRGLMVIPDPSLPEDVLRQQMREVQHHWQALQTDFQEVDTLSMGMSADLALAIACGSTQVRIGSALFGKRKPKPSG